MAKNKKRQVRDFRNELSNFSTFISQVLHWQDQIPAFGLCSVFDFNVLRINKKIAECYVEFIFVLIDLSSRKFKTVSSG